MLKKRPFHLLPAVNTLFNALLQNDRFRQLDFRSLVSGRRHGRQRVHGRSNGDRLTGSTMIEGWGMSETCAIGTNNPVNASSFSGSIGLPLPGIDIAIKDDAGASRRPARPGRSASAAPTSCPGY